MAAVRAGLKITWCSEIDETMTKLQQHLFTAPNHGDATQIQYDSIQVPDILKTGMPCPDYVEALGSGLGSKGKTGHLYIKQVAWILTLGKRGLKAAILEQTASAIRINQGKEVRYILHKLSEQFYVHYAIIPVWKYGDVSYRKRLIIIIFNRQLGPAGAKYQFPAGKFNSKHYPTAADIAVPDSDVPTEYIIKQQPVHLYRWSEPQPGKIHQIGDFGDGAGHCDLPHPYQSWCGLPGTQLTSNGGSRRTMLNWYPGAAHTTQRLSVPVETARIASMPTDYITTVKQFYDTLSTAGSQIYSQGKQVTADQFIRQCINNGVPMQTSTALDQSIISHLDSIDRHRDQNTTASTAYATQIMSINDLDESLIRSQLVDIGASGSLNQPDVSPYLQQPRRSQYEIQVAEKHTTMKGIEDGKLTIHVLNTARQPGFQPVTPLTLHTTTVSSLRTELLSLDEHYRSGRCNLLIRQPDYESGVSEIYRAAKGDQPELRIPIRYDYDGPGGWWIDYILHPNPQPVHANLIQCNQHSSITTTAPELDIDEAEQVITELMKANSITRRAKYANNTVTIEARHPDERAILGVKAGLKPARQRLSQNDAHIHFGHLGMSKGECWICSMAKGEMKRYTMKVAPYRETRYGHTWYMDGVTWSHRSLEGSKYMVTLRDVASRAIFKLCLYLRSDITAHLKPFIEKLRANPAFHACAYRIFSVVYTDNPGEWSDTCVNWQEFTIEMKFETRHTTPETSKELGIAEKTNDIVEKTVKAILLQQNLPPDHWQVAANAAEFLLLRFPTVAADSTAAVDGDQPRPLEKLMLSTYSRRQIDRELSYFELPGTVALVHVKAKGSTLAPKVRWAVAWGMYREQIVWRCPYTHSTFRSKSYSVIKLNHNMNYGHFFGKPTISTRRQCAIPSDRNDKIDVYLDEIRPVTERITVPITDIKVITDGTADSQQARIKTIQTTPNQELGGSVRVYDSNGQQLEVDEKTGELNIPQANDQPMTELHTTEQPSPTDEGVAPDSDEPGDSRLHRLTQDGGADSMQNQLKQMQLEPMMSGTQDKTDGQGIDKQTDDDRVTHSHQPDTDGINRENIDKELWNELFEYDDSEYNDSNEFNQLPDDDEDDDWHEEWQEELDRIAETLGEQDCHTAGEGFTFSRLCKVHEVPAEMHNAYYRWLMNLTTANGMRFSQLTIPKQGPRESRGGYIEPGLKIPPPYGKQWREILQEQGIERSQHNRMRVIQSNQAIQKAMHHVHNAVKIMQHIPQQDMNDSFTQSTAYKAKKRKQSAVAAGSAGNKQPPASISKALRQDDREEAFKWLESINTEWNGLCQLQVLKHDLTREELKQMGIDSNPIDFSICLTYKFSDTGEINRYKTRFAIAGHPGNLQKGIHYDKTYASTPNQNSSRLLLAIMVRYRMKQLAFDVSMAYANANLPKNEYVAVRYPAGFKRYKTVNGKQVELFMALIKNLYGLPQAGRHWEKTRNRVLISLFSKSPWTIKQSIKEPCLFYIRRHTATGTERVFALIHTDDADMIGDTDEVLQAVYDKISATWKCKRVDPSFILGIKRTVSETPDEMTVTCTMQAFIEGAAAAFKDHLLKRRVETPIPPGTFLYKPVKSNTTTAEHYLRLGYQRLFGMLLWAARGVYPECLAGTSMAGRLITAPTQEAWHCLCWMLTYMHQRRTRGIKFSNRGNDVPITFVDASNKPDPTDGKCQYGYNTQMQGGMIIAVSKKHNHVGQSAAHNEYMALTMAARHMAWLRDLLTELDLEEMMPPPAILLGDNRAANLLSQEDIVSTGNQFIQLPYHYIKQEVRAGLITVLDVMSADNIADLMTKGVSRQVAQKLIPILCGYDHEQLTAIVDRVRQRNSNTYRQQPTNRTSSER